VSGQRFEFDFNIALGAEEGNRAFFGQNVLQGLVDGIADFAPDSIDDELHVHIDDEAREHIGDEPVLLGCAPWVDDHALVGTIECLPRACVVISKEPRTRTDVLTFRRLRQVNERTDGIELWTFPYLGGMAPKWRGKPYVIEPGEPSPVVSTFRTIGHRRTERRLPPIAHAKLALLGYIRVSDEVPGTDYPGGEFRWFDAKRLWVSSANFTFASRSHLEFGYWTEDPDLVGGAKRFLLKLIGASEDLDAEADTPDPDIVGVEFNHQAFVEASIEAERAEEELRWAEAELRGEEVDDEEW
jgi:hypothetical protein